MCLPACPASMGCSCCVNPSEEGEAGAGCFTQYSHGILRLCRGRGSEGQLQPCADHVWLCQEKPLQLQVTSRHYLNLLCCCRRSDFHRTSQSGALCAFSKALQGCCKGSFTLCPGSGWEAEEFPSRTTWFPHSVD